MNRPLYFIILFFLLSLGAGGAARIDPASAQDGAITGTVILEDGSPVEDVQIDLGQGNSRPAEWRSTKTGSDGNFKVTGLGPGLYSLYATLPGYLTSSGDSESASGRIGDHVTIRLIKGGVITGAVTGENGEPLTGAAAYARRIRDAEGRPIAGEERHGGWGRFTDDRGVYRLYQLNPGSYIVEVDIQPIGTGQGDPEAPTSHPSSSRESAAEVTVRAGQEVVGINIQYRGKPGSAHQEPLKPNRVKQQ